MSPTIPLAPATNGVTPAGTPPVSLAPEQRPDQGGDGADKDSASPGSLVTLDILAAVKAAQGAHGLKHGDFTRYSQYCTRRLLRVRRATHLTHGRGRFVPRVVCADDARRDHRALLLPLTEAERAWSTAMALKRAANASGLTGPPVSGGGSGGAIGSGTAAGVLSDGQRRRKVISKLNRATQAAGRLRELCGEVGDEHTMLEAEAYAKWMAATLDLEREEWGTALAAFEVVERVYEGMVAMSLGMAAAGVFEERAEEVATAIRFCRYNLARSGQGGGDEEELLRGFRETANGAAGDDMLGQKIEAVLADARRTAARNLGEVEWCGNAVPLRSGRVREAVLLAAEKSKELRQDESRRKSIDAFDGVFIAYNDAIQIVNKEIAEFRRATTSRAEEHIAELDLLAAYLTHGRISHTIERNLLLVENLNAKRMSKPDDFVRLFDNLVQNQTDILGLAGVDADAGTYRGAESQRIVFRTQRCFHLAECYRVAEMYREAVALYDQVAVLARPLSGSYAEDVKEAVSQSRCLKCRVRATEFIKQASISSELSALGLASNEGVNTEDGGLTLGAPAAMVDHLDKFVSFAGDPSGMRTIIEMPPPLEAVPCKPVMFDLAIDGIKFPEPPSGKEVVTEKILSSEIAGTQQTGTYFGRWWSSSSTKP
jgi:signal recognition particle subunit SRP68